VGASAAGWLLAVDDVDAASGEDVEAYVSAHLGPLVVLFGEDGADESDQCVAVGEAGPLPSVATSFSICRVETPSR
jgi:hypothetical protein